MKDSDKIRGALDKGCLVLSTLFRAVASEIDLIRCELIASDDSRLEIVANKIELVIERLPDSVEKELNSIFSEESN